MPRLDQIRESIEARLAELKNEITALQAARAALHGNNAIANTTTASPLRAAKPRGRRTSTVAGGGHGADGAAETSGGPGGEAPGAAASQTPTAPAEAPLKPRRRTQSKSPQSRKRSEVLLAGKLQAMLSEADDGLSAIMIAKQSNAGYNQVRQLLRELEDSGHIRRTGTRRTTLWRLITEEERIAERVAELEHLSVARKGGPTGSDPSAAPERREATAVPDRPEASAAPDRPGVSKVPDRP